MILQILSDARQMMRGRDAMFCQRRAVADAGQHQELRGLERAGGKDHFAARADLPGFLALPVFDADRALGLEQATPRPRMALRTLILARALMVMAISPPD